MPPLGEHPYHPHSCLQGPALSPSPLPLRDQPCTRPRHPLRAEPAPLTLPPQPRPAPPASLSPSRPPARDTAEDAAAAREDGGGLGTARRGRGAAEQVRARHRGAGDEAEAAADSRDAGGCPFAAVARGLRAAEEEEAEAGLAGAERSCAPVPPGFGALGLQAPWPAFPPRASAPLLPCPGLLLGTETGPGESAGPGGCRSLPLPRPRAVSTSRDTPGLTGWSWFSYFYPPFFSALQAFW